MDSLQLLKVWREHIADVHERRGRSTVYHLENMHTCHGCGDPSGIIHRGLCQRCEEAYNRAVQE